MKLSKARRLLVLGITVPALLTGGLAAAASSNAASPAAPDVTARLATSTATAASAWSKVPYKCRRDKMRLRDRTNIYGRKGKLIGHVSLYYQWKNARKEICVITWRNGVARGNAGYSGAYLRCKGHNGNYIRGEAYNSVRSRPARATRACTFQWYGEIHYKGWRYGAAIKTRKKSVY